MSAVPAVPRDWALETLADLHMGGTGTLRPQDYPDEEFDHYSIPAYQDSGEPTIAQGREILSQKLLLQAPCVLFGKLNPRVQKVWNVAPSDSRRCLASTEWLPVFPKTGFDRDFIHYLLWSDWVMPFAQRLVTGSTPSRQRVDPKSFYSIQVPVPPLSEQEQIAAALRIVDSGRSLQSRFVRHFAQLKRAAMRALFTRGLRDDPQRETEIGPLPKGWDLVRVSEAVKPLRFDARRQIPTSEYARSGRWPIIDQGQGEIAGYTDDEACLVGRKGPIIVFGDHTRVIKFVDFDFALGAQGTKPLVPVERFDAKLLFHALSHLDVPNRGYNRHFKVFRELLIAEPPNDEQREIVAILDALDRKADLHRRKRAVLDDLFKTLLHELMTGEIRVAELNLPASLGEGRS